jgi:hypothetical protein
MELQKQIDEILELYTQQRLAELLGISQWQLLEKMQDNRFTVCESNLIKNTLIAIKIIGHYNPYNLEVVLEKLKWATEYLLHTKNYDGHNYEELNECVIKANGVIETLKTREAHLFL